MFKKHAYYHKSNYFNINLDPILMLAIIGLLIYSVIIIWAASNQNISILENKIQQIFFSLTVMIIMSKISINIYEKLAPYIYIFSIILLIIVYIFGHPIKGVRRWLYLGSTLRFEPSEIAKISVPLMLARFLNYKGSLLGIKHVIISLILIFIPTILVALQPDLGTAILIAISGIFVIFFSGIRLNLILLVILLIISCIPILWIFFMHNYQKLRIMAFLNPNLDHLGVGYHIIQSQIAIGSGGNYGKGWLQGTQSQLNFLPEHHTDFIFAVLAEELGFIGVIILLIFYLIIIIRSFNIAMKIRNKFATTIIVSLMSTLFFYIFLNIGMVIGILPIVGIPLPLISYGGSSLMIIMSGFGIIMSIYSTNKKIYYYRK